MTIPGRTISDKYRARVRRLAQDKADLLSDLIKHHEQQINCLHQRRQSMLECPDCLDDPKYEVVAEQLVAEEERQLAKEAQTKTEKTDG